MKVTNVETLKQEIHFLNKTLLREDHQGTHHLLVGFHLCLDAREALLPIFSYFEPYCTSARIYVM